MSFLKDLSNDKVFLFDSGQGTFLEGEGVNITETKLWGSTPFIKPDFFKSSNISVDKKAIIKMLNEFQICDLISIPTYQLCYDLFLEVLKLEKSIESETNYKELLSNITNFTREYSPDKQLVGSIGCFGASIAEEFSGDYPENIDYYEFFRPQLECFNHSENVDIIGFETIPNFEELKSILNWGEDKLSKNFYLSLSCKDDCELELRDGTPLKDIAKYIKNLYEENKINKNLVLLGVNCCSFYSSLPNVQELNKYLNDNKLRCKFIVYPNSGEIFDKVKKTWSEPKDILHSSKANWVKTVKLYAESNCKVIGGCCRTTPDDLKIIKLGINQLQAK
ncbi:hypothetical protein QEN19_004253 [Hanseniaspora menglaensis]